MGIGAASGHDRAIALLLLVLGAGAGLAGDDGRHHRGSGAVAPEGHAVHRTAHRAARPLSGPGVPGTPAAQPQLRRPQWLSASAVAPRQRGGLWLRLAQHRPREQFAAALRVTMAEVLAEAYDGTLPVLFDDAFANSDPERQAGVYRMLHQAADQGLQVILLTCDPERSQTIPGASRVILGR